MELPVQSNPPELRAAADIHALGKALQANLVQLRVEAQRRDDADHGLEDLNVPSPGAVTELRAALIDRHRIRAYTDVELHMRLREQWGAHCALCWLVRAGGAVLDFGGPLPDADMHCVSAIETKIAEVHAMLWRVRYELRLRQDTEFRESPPARRNTLLAARVPLVVQRKMPDKASDAELLAAACEHAGMLAALRWSIRPARLWGDLELMAVSDEPF